MIVWWDHDCFTPLTIVHLLTIFFVWLSKDGGDCDEAPHSGGRQATFQREESAERPSRPARQAGPVGQVGPGADFAVNLQEGLGDASNSDAQPQEGE